MNGRASGWPQEFEWRNGDKPGVWVRPQWTPDGTAAVTVAASGQLPSYRYFSPSFRCDLETGLITGYYEPLVEASRTPRGIYRFPLYRTPPDLAARKPYWTRQQIETLPAARASLRGSELAYVADPLDALILQIQGSGRLNLTEANGGRRLLRVAYAAHNDQPLIVSLAASISRHDATSSLSAIGSSMRPKLDCWPHMRAK